MASVLVSSVLLATSVLVLVVRVETSAVVEGLEVDSVEISLGSVGVKESGSKCVVGTEIEEEGPPGKVKESGMNWVVGPLGDVKESCSKCVEG